MHIPLGGYPNRFAEVPEHWTLDTGVAIKPNLELNTQAFVASAIRCIDNGATMYGGVAESDLNIYSVYLKC